jgi:hypothetical protein
MEILIAIWLLFGMVFSFVALFRDRCKNMEGVTVMDLSTAFVCGLTGPFSVPCLIVLNAIDDINLS